MKIFSIKLIVALGLLMTPGFMKALAQDKADCLAIIVNKDNKLADVSLGELQKYFKAEKSKTPDGVKLAIVMADTGRPEREAALKVIYGMSEAEYNDYFVGQTFTGAVASAPKAFGSPAAIKQFVASTPGAIGYVGGADLDDSVAVVKIGGKVPGDVGYPLKLK